MGDRKTREGVVVGDKMEKTRVVRIERVYRHPRYQRVVRTAKRLKAHDERNETRIGDRVILEETRPISKEKRWRIRQIVRTSEAARASSRPPAARPPAAQGEQALQ